MRWLWPARLPDMRDRDKPVHDGDTLWVQVDRGDYDTSTWNIRLDATKAPELGKVGGSETHQQVLSWLNRYGGFSLTPWPFTLETFKTRGGNVVMTLGRYTGRLWAGEPDAVRAGANVPSLNVDMMAWLATQPPEWGGGIGG